MTDVHTPEQRSLNMARIKATDTKPEMAARRAFHMQGYRYRLHRKDLPGKPDMVFPKYKMVVFIHGCFWHSHSCKYGSVQPKTNIEFWSSKRQRTVERDQENIFNLEKSGWKAFIIWECETKNLDELSQIVGCIIESA